MDLASQVRNRDVALGLLRRAKLPSDSSLLAALAAERKETEQALAAELKHWAKRGFHKKLRSQLGL